MAGDPLQDIGRNAFKAAEKSKAVSAIEGQGSDIGFSNYLTNPLELFSIPQRALTGTARALTGEGLGGFTTAFSKEYGGSPSTLIREQTGGLSGETGAIGGLLLDVIIDPLTIGNPLSVVKRLSKLENVMDINKTIRTIRKENISNISGAIKNKASKVIDVIAGENAPNVKENIKTVINKINSQLFDKTAGVDKDYIELINHVNKSKDVLANAHIELNNDLIKLIPDEAKRKELGTLLYLQTDSKTQLKAMQEIGLDDEVADNVYSLLKQRDELSSRIKELDIIKNADEENLNYLTRIAKLKEDNNRSTILDYLTGKKLIDDNTYKDIVGKISFNTNSVQHLNALRKKVVPDQVFEEIVKSDAKGWWKVDLDRASKLNEEKLKILDSFIAEPKNVVWAKGSNVNDKEKFISTVAEKGLPKNLFKLNEFDGYDTTLNRVLSSTLLQQKGLVIQDEFLDELSKLSKSKKDGVMFSSSEAKELIGDAALKKKYTHLDGDKWGRFKGSYLRRDVADNIGEIRRLKEKGGEFQDALRNWESVWKKSKTAYNFPSHVNQIIGNTIHMDIMGFRLSDMKHFVKGWSDFKSLIKHQVAGTVPESSTELRKVYDAGLFQGSISADLNDISKGIEGVDNRDILRITKMFSDGNILRKMKSIDDKILKKLENIWGLEDNFVRFAMFRKLHADKFKGKQIKDLNRKELDDLVEATKNKFVDYDRSGKFIDTLARHPFVGSPFIRFAFNNSVLWMKEAIYNPWKYAKYRVLIDQMNRHFAEQEGISEDMYEKKVRQTTPGYMDLDRTVSWGKKADGDRFFLNLRKYDSLADIRNGEFLKSTLKGGPISEALVESVTGRDSFTGKDKTQGNVLSDLVTSAIPTPFVQARNIESIFDALVEKKTRYGETKDLGVELLKAIPGLSLSKKNPSLTRTNNVRKALHEFNEIKKIYQEKIINSNDIDRKKDLAKELNQIKVNMLQPYF
jgi:hypothetical protein